MAIFSTGVGIGAISGNVGGANFVNARGSKIIRKTRRPSPNNTAAQQKQQIKMAIFVRKWRELEEDERTAWATYAANRPASNRIGVSRQLSGYQSFLKYFMFANTGGVENQFLPRIDLQPQFLSNFRLNLSLAANLLLEWDSPIPGAAKSVRAYARPLYRTTTGSYNGNYTFVAEEFGAGDALPMVDGFEDNWGLPQIGQVIAVRAIPINLAARIPEAIIDLQGIVTA